MFGYKGQDLFITPIAGLYDYIASTTPPRMAHLAKRQYTNNAVLMHHIEMFEAAFPEYELIAA